MKTVGIVALGKKNSGGIHQYTWSLIDALKRDQSKKYIIICEEESEFFKDSKFEIRKIKDNTSKFYKKIIIFYLYLFIIRSKFFLSKSEKNLFNDIDYFIVPTISGFPHFFLNKPFIFTLHDMQEKYYPEYFSIFRRLLRWLNNRALSTVASKIICESQYVKSDIIKFLKVKEDKIAVITGPPPMSLINFKIDNSKIEKIKQKYDIKKKYIFYPAQTWSHKNHLRLIDAFKIILEQHDDVDLILTGSPKANHTIIMKKINDNNLSSKIKHLGYVDYLDLPYLYKLSEFLIMPSLFESVSIPIYEAFALKVPVTCSNVVSLPEQVGNAALLFDPLDSKDMSKKIMKYLDDENLRKKNSELGFEKIKDFNHDRYCDKLKKIIDELQYD
tara:strand:+ start:940 stop:2097 length:1158 start_codon:yes stop_codon:yes gene_type:complete